jgi:hypothetical protein
MNTCGSGGIAPLIFNLFTSWRWAVNRPLLSPQECASWVGGWVGLRTDLDVVEMRDMSCFCQESNLDSSVLKPLMRLCTDRAIPAVISPHRMKKFKQSTLEKFFTQLFVSYYYRFFVRKWDPSEHWIWFSVHPVLDLFIIPLLVSLCGLLLEGGSLFSM